MCVVSKAARRRDGGVRHAASLPARRDQSDGTRHRRLSLSGTRKRLQGPCIACPAHAFVFDAGSGRCLTNPGTPDARTHTVGGTCGLALCLSCRASARLPGLCSASVRRVSLPHVPSDRALRPMQVPGMGCGDTKAHRGLRVPDARPVPQQQHAGADGTRGRQRHPACHGRQGAQAKIRR